MTPNCLLTASTVKLFFLNRHDIMMSEFTTSSIKMVTHVILNRPMDSCESNPTYIYTACDMNAFPRRLVVGYSGKRLATQPDESAIQEISISLLRSSRTSSTTIRGERYHVFEAMSLHRVWNSRVTFLECAKQVTCFLFWFLLYFNWHQDWNGGFRISPHFFSGRVRRLSWYLHGIFLNDDLRWSCLCRS